jgi:hypothetical protein
MAQDSKVFAKVGLQYMNGFITEDEAIFDLVEAGWTREAAKEHVARWARIGAGETSSSQK